MHGAATDIGLAVVGLGSILGTLAIVLASPKQPRWVREYDKRK